MSLFAPGSDDCGSLISGLRSLVASFEGESRHTLHRFETLLEDLISTVQYRVTSDDTARQINIHYDAARASLESARRELEEAEYALESLRGVIVSLDTTW